MNVPLFTGGRLTVERRAAALDQQRRARQLRDARNRVTEQVRDGEAELKAARSDVVPGTQQVRLARDQVELAQGRFSAGVTDNIEVTTAQDELAKANDAEIAAYYRYDIARADLARTVGSIEPLTAALSFWSSKPCRIESKYSSRKSSRPQVRLLPSIRQRTTQVT